MPKSPGRVVALVFVFSILLGAIFWLALQFSGTWELGDFNVTFYRVARYSLRGENVYINSYSHPYNGRDYPPFAPLWSLYVFVPFGTLPLPVAEALRVVLDIVFLPFLAYVSARWAGLRAGKAGLLLVLAPWLLTEVHSGQLTPLVFLGVFLSYWGVRRKNAPMAAVGLWLVLSKPNIVVLVVLATALFAWRNKILFRTLAIFLVLVAIGSLTSPLWFVDLLGLYVERLAHPRPADSILLLPGYPWGQLALLSAGALFLLWYVWRFNRTQPEPWLWALLVGASLVGAPHTFNYDWQLLMPLLALLLRVRWGSWFAAALYLYSLIWTFLADDFGVPVPSMRFIPGLVLVVFGAWCYMSRSTLMAQGA